MGRYDLQTTKKLFNGKSVYTTTIYPKIPYTYGDTYVIAADYDRLDTLANQFYGDPGLWWVIAEANNVGKGTLRLQAGQQLRIPTNVQKIIGDLKKK